jgi:uncharacterized repeat protein (TIGR01451 family)
LTQLAAGTAYALNEIAAGTTTLSLYTATQSCTNAATGSTTTLPTAVPGAITPQLGDVITCTITNTRRNTAVLTLAKSSAVVSDPINGTVNPLMIPGAVVRYSIIVTNVGNTTVDASTIVLTDALPANIILDRTSAITFTNGTTASGLNAFNASTMVTYSNQAGGGAPYTYTPISTLDPAVRGLRVAPTGTMAAATSATVTPSFTISFLARIP